jgi:hypothetical protein
MRVGGGEELVCPPPEFESPRQNHNRTSMCFILISCMRIVTSG